jgi:hypothetical protein
VEAAEMFVRAEVRRLAKTTIDDLRSRPAMGYFGDIAPQHFWDEYCWNLQEGPFDDEDWDDLVLASLHVDAAKLLPHTLRLLSAMAIENEPESCLINGNDGVWMDGIASLALEDVKDCASKRDLGLIGPNRIEEFLWNYGGSGLIWTTLSNAGEIEDLVSEHFDELVSKDDDTSDLVDKMTDLFLESAIADAENTEFLHYFFDNIGDDIKPIIRDSVKAELDDMKSDLPANLGG